MRKIRIPSELQDFGPKDRSRESLSARSNIRKTIALNSKENKKDEKLIPTKFNAELLPLCYFDDDNYETQDLEKLSIAVSNDALISGNTIMFCGKFSTWAPALVLNISADKSTFLIEYVDNDIRKFVGRLNIMFSTESKEKFLERRRLAFESRDRFMRLQRLYAYMDMTLSPNDSFLKANALKRLCALMPPDCLTNFQRIAKILREICLLDVSLLYIDNYKLKLTNDPEFQDETKDRKFPLIDDFEPPFIIKEHEIDIGIDIFERALYLEENTKNFSISSFFALFEIRKKIVFINEQILFRIPFHETKVHNLVDDIKSQIATFVLKIGFPMVRDIFNTAKGYPFIDPIIAYSLDEMIQYGLTEVCMNAANSLYDALVDRKIHFSLIITKYKYPDVSERIEELLSLVELIENCWEMVELHSIKSLVTSENTLIHVFHDTMKPCITRLRDFIKFDIAVQLKTVERNLISFIEEFCVDYKFNDRIIRNIDRTIITDHLGYALKYASTALPFLREQKVELINLASKMSNQLIPLIETYGKIILPNVFINFIPYQLVLIKDLQSKLYSVLLKLHYYAMSMLSALYAKIEEMKIMVIRVPPNIYVFIELQNYFASVPSLIDNFKHKIKEVNEIYNLLAKHASPMGHPLLIKEYCFKQQLYVFNKAFHLRKMKLDSCIERLRKEHDEMEQEIIEKLAQLDKDLNNLVQHHFSKNHHKVFGVASNLFNGYEVLIPKLKELETGLIILNRTRYDDSQFWLSHDLSENLMNLWGLICDFMETNEKTASVPISMLNASQLKEQFKRWNEKLANISFQLANLPQPKSVVDRLLNSIRDFGDFIPIIEVFASSILRKRHWSRIIDTLRNNVDSSVTLYYLVDIKILEYRTEIMNIYEDAKNEYVIEVTLDKLISDLTHLVFEPKISTLRQLIIDLRIIVNDQEEELKRISQSPYVEPFVKRIEEHSELLFKLNRLFVLLDKILNYYFSQKDFMKADDTIEHNPRLSEQFIEVRSSFANIVKKMKVCTIAASQYNLYKLVYDNFLLLRKDTLAYVEVRRASFDRFYFLSNSELFYLISSSRHFKKFSKNIRMIIPYVDGIVLEANQVVGVKSRNEETVRITPFDYVVRDLPSFFDQLIGKISLSVKASLESILERNHQSFVNRINIFPFQSIFLYMNLRFTGVMNDITSEKEALKELREMENMKSILANSVKNKATRVSVLCLIDYCIKIIFEMGKLNDWELITAEHLIRTSPSRSKNALQSTRSVSFINPSSVNVYITQNKADTVSPTRKLSEVSSMKNFTTLPKILEDTKVDEIKRPLFLQFVINEEKDVIVKLFGYEIKYGFEYIGNSLTYFQSTNSRDLLKFIEALSYNKACSFPIDSITANRFITEASLFYGSFLFSVHLSNHYSRKRFENYLIPLAKKPYWLHFEDFPTLSTISQNNIIYKSCKSTEGYTFMSGCSFSNVHFLNLRPVILNTRNLYQLSTVFGAGDDVKRESLQDLSQNCGKEFVEIKTLSPDDDYTNKFVWYRRPVDYESCTLAEPVPYLLTDDGMRIFIHPSSDIIFDTSLSSQIPNGIYNNIDFIESNDPMYKFSALADIVTKEVSDFIVEQSYSLGESDAIVVSLASSIFPPNREEIMSLVPSFKKFDVDFDQLVTDCLNRNKSLIIIGENTIERLSWAFNFFSKLDKDLEIVFSPDEADEPNSLCLLFRYNEIQDLNPQFFYFIVQADLSSIPLECSYFLQFVPWDLIPKQNVIKAQSVDTAVEMLIAKNVLFSLFCGFSHVPDIDYHYEFLPKNSKMHDFLYQFLMKMDEDNEEPIIIFIQDSIYKLKSLIELDLSLFQDDFISNMKKLLNFRFIYVTELNLEDFNFFFKDCIDYFKLTLEIDRTQSFSFTEQFISYTNQLNLSEENLKRSVTYYHKYLQILIPPIQEKVFKYQKFNESFNYLIEVEEDAIQKYANALEDQKHAEIELELIVEKLKVAREDFNEFKSKTDIERGYLIPLLKKESDEFTRQNEEIERILPPLRRAENFINNFDQNAINMIRAIRSPTPSILPIYECYSLIFDVKPHIKTVGRSKFFDYFEPMRNIINDPNFAKQLLGFMQIQMPKPKLEKLKRLMEKSESVWARTLQTNKDFVSITKWFKKLIIMNEMRVEVSPKFQELAEQKQKVDEIIAKLKEIDRQLALREARIEELLALKEQIDKKLDDTTATCKFLNTRKDRIHTLNKVLEPEIAQWKLEEEKIKHTLEIADTIAFSRSMAVCELASMHYSDHKENRKQLFESFPAVHKIHSTFDKLMKNKLRHIGVWNDKVLVEKLIAVLDEINVPIIFDPTGLCLYILRLLYPHIQMMSSIEPNDEIEPDTPFYVLLDDTSQAYQVLGRGLRVFIFTNLLPSEIEKPLYKYFLIIDFTVFDFLSIIREHFLIAIRPRLFEGLTKSEDELLQLAVKKWQTAESIAESIKEHSDFFEGEMWNNCKNFFFVCATNSKRSLAAIERSRESLQEARELIESLAVYSQSLFVKLYHVIDVTSHSLFNAFINLVTSCTENDQIIDLVKSCFKLSYQHSFKDISFEITREFVINYEEKEFDGVCDSKFKWKFLADRIDSSIPLVIQCKIHDDPTPFILREARDCIVLNLSDDIDSSYYRYSGWLIIRYPDYQDNGINMLLSYLDKLFTLHQFPNSFRLFIIFDTVSDIPFQVLQISIKFDWPLLAPPSIYYENYMRMFSNIELTNLQKVNLQIISNFVNSLSVFARPTTVFDLVQNHFELGHMKTCDLLDLDKLKVFVDQDWITRNIALKSSSIAFIDTNSTKLRISKTEFDGAIKINSVSALDCNWDAKLGIFIEVQRFYPIPLGDIWIGESEDENDCTSIIWGDDPIRHIADLQIPGHGSYHFLLES